MQSSAAFGCLVVASVVSLVACNDDAKSKEGAPSTVVPLVLQGQKDSADPAVVALRMGDDYYCSGTVVAPMWVLTAAHCFARGGAVSVSFKSSNIFAGGSWKPTKAVHAHPSFAGGAYEYDIALVELAAPTDVTPIAINVDHEAARRIDRVRMVGYGPTATGWGNEGTKRTADVPVRAEWAYFDTRSGSGSCYGDSGGPSFANIDGTEKVVAVTSHGLEARCENGGRIVRTDQHRAFLAKYLDLPAEPVTDGPPPVAAVPRLPIPAPPDLPAPGAAVRSRLDCTGSQQLVVRDTTIVVTEGAAIRASGSCQVVLQNVDVKGPIGIEASGSAQVIMTSGSIDAAKAFTSSGSATVNLAGTRFTGSATGPSSLASR